MYLLRMSGVTESERRIASEAIEGLRSKRDKPRDEPKPAPGKRKEKGRT
jgi:hypothetical protein